MYNHNQSHIIPIFPLHDKHQSLIIYTNYHKCVPHCKNIWVTSTILWSSQLHACCVRDTLQTSRDASNLIESLSVVEMLLLFVNLDLLAESLAIWLHSWITMQPRNSSRGGCVGSKKHQTLPEMLIYRLSARRS